MSQIGFDVEIPFHDYNGHMVIYDRDYVEHDYVRDFVEQYKHLFQRAEYIQAWVYMPFGCIHAARVTG